MSLKTPRDVQEALEQALRKERAEYIARELRPGRTYHCYQSEPGSVYWVARRNYEGRCCTTYRIDAQERTCTCPDFEKRRDACKHILAVEICLKEIEEEEALCALAADYDPLADEGCFSTNGGGALW